MSSALAAVSWVAVVAALAAYGSGHRHLFDKANAVLCVPIALPALIVGAYSSAAISLAFGAIGAWRITTHRKERTVPTPEERQRQYDDEERRGIELFHALRRPVPRPEDRDEAYSEHVEAIAAAPTHLFATETKLGLQLLETLTATQKPTYPITTDDDNGDDAA